MSMRCRISKLDRNLKSKIVAMLYANGCAAEEKRDLTAEEENAYIQNIVDICKEIMQDLSCGLVEAYKEISE